MHVCIRATHTLTHMKTMYTPTHTYTHNTSTQLHTDMLFESSAIKLALILLG